MPTRQRQKNAPPEQPVPLVEGARSVGYAPESLRRYMWALDPEARPPLRKLRGRWVVLPSELAAWANQRDAQVAS